MSHGARLPALYPMPRDIGQYRVCYEAALEGLTKGQYEERLRRNLRKEDGGEYAPSMIEGIFSRVVRTGFIRKQSGHILPPDESKHRWDGKWDGSEERFPVYIRETLLKWGKLFPDGLVLAYNILSHLGTEPLTQPALITSLTGDEESPGKYDGRDRYAHRTIRELLKLLEYAGWVERQGRAYGITRDGARFRGELRKRDTYHQVATILTTVDPVATDIFTPDEKIKLAKHYMYRECGGKYRSEMIKKAHKIIFRYPYHYKRQPEIEEGLKKEEDKRDTLKEEIRELDAAFGKQVEYFRSRVKLKLIRDALVAGSKVQAWDIIQESGGNFSWESVRQLKHEGPNYTIRPGLEPYEWQQAALKEWESRGRTGVLEVVTGAGKTVFALIAMAALLREDPETRVTVLVPTKVLMYQWATELVRTLGVPPEHIGLRGDRHKDSFEAGKQVMITIINSAVLDNYLVRDVDSLSEDLHHLVIADECHRYRGGQFRKAFEARFEYSLGLSATPVDPDKRLSPKEAERDKDVIIAALGEIFFQYSYKEALRDDIVQEFIVKYLGVELTPEERRLYDAYTKHIRKCLDRIRQRYGPRLEAMTGPFFARLHSILNLDDHPDPAISKYFTAVRERKDLVFAARNRKWAYLDIIQQHTVGKKPGQPDDKIIVFHERIENLKEIVAPTDYRKAIEGDESTRSSRSLGELESEVPAKYRSDPVEKEVDMNLESLFFKAAFKPVMYHSGHSSPAWNDIGMEWFREDIANVMLSVKALVEGVDVPTANIGIIRASSSSVRQRIQTTGRILRRAAGKNRPAILYVIYVRNTTDERIFRGTDWAEQLGSTSIESYHWRPPDDPTACTGVWENRHGELPDIPEFDEEDDVEDFDVDDLAPGDSYPGRYAGWEYHVDARGRPFKKTRAGRRFIANQEVKQAAQRIFGFKRGGKFVITPDNHIVTKVKGVGLVFAGVLEEELEFERLSRRQLQPRLESEPPTFEELFWGG